MIRALSLALVLIAAACGSSKPTPTTSSEHAATADNEGAEHHEMGNMPPEIAKFHDVLAPHWHAEKGAQRMKDTCSAMPDLHASADALAQTTPPATANADSWTTGTRELVAAVASLDATCKSNDPTSFETAFAKLHESFHGLMAQAGGHKEGMEGHEEMEHGEHKM
jgi:hypothetical protein